MKLSAEAAERLASREPIRTRPSAEDKWVAAVSRSHLDSQTSAFIKQRGATRLPIGSALKFCRVAEGAADIYPRLSAISEWDIAAGHAILEAAGGDRYGQTRPAAALRRTQGRFRRAELHRLGRSVEDAVVRAAPPHIFNCQTA